METQTITMPDQSSLKVKWFGDTPEQKGVVLFLPALGVSIDYYQPLAKRWADYGYKVALIESRGMRHSSVKDVKRQNFGYQEVLNIDIGTIVPALSEAVGQQPVWLCGHSLGGQFSLLYASKENHNLAGVILIAAGSNYYGSMPTGSLKFKRRIGIRLIRLINNAMGYFPGHKLGFGGRQPKNLIKDWTYEGLKGSYAIAESNDDYNKLLADLDIPVLMISLSGDKLVPKSSADFLAGKLKSADVTQVELDAKEHGLIAFNHFKWTKQPEPVLKVVDEWVDKMLSSNIENRNHYHSNR